MKKQPRCKECGRRHISYWNQLKHYWKTVFRGETKEHIARSMSHMVFPQRFVFEMKKPPDQIKIDLFQEITGEKLAKT